MQHTTKAKLKTLRIAPRKVRLVVDLIRGLNVDEARAQLQFSPKRAAIPVKKLLESAMANATHNHDMKPETLVVKEVYVDGGPILYRWMPRAFGRATKIRKRTSHITLVLEGTVEEKKATKKTKKEETTSPDAAEKTTKKTEKKAPASKKKTATKKVTKKTAASKKEADA